MRLDSNMEGQLDNIISSLDLWFDKSPIIDRNRTNFLHFDEDPKSLEDIRNEIAASWIRSKKVGCIPQNQISSKMQLSRLEFERAMRKNRVLLETAVPILEESSSIFNRINSFGIALFDPNSILLSLHNFPLKKIQPGLDFSEEKIGTSAVSISRAQNQAAFLLGSEIYNDVLRFSKFIVSIPIHDPNGETLGFFAAPFFQKLHYTNEEKHLLSFLVSWQFSTVQRIQETLHQDKKKLYVTGLDLSGSTSVKKDKNLDAIYSFVDIIGESHVMMKTKEIATKLAHSPGNIKLAGESGTGKELFAHAIHNEFGPEKPFVAINCAAIPEDLIESELFGYVGGSFTGAERNGRMGKIEMANGGTLFLDEIGDLPLKLQPVLLRVLEDKRVMRVGDNKYIPVKFRVISATNRNLLEMVKRNEFREDLYYRLAALKLQIPSLKKRGNDIVDLAQIFINNTCKQLDRPTLQLDPAVVDCFLQYDWPGNIRELKNCIIWAVTVADKKITLDDLPEEMLNNVDFENNQNLSNMKQKVVEEFELANIRNVMIQCNHNISQAAKLLGISRPTLYRKLEQYGYDNKLL